MENIQQFLKESKKELKKISWPDKPKVMETSLVVGGCALIFAAYLYVVDLAFSWGFSLVLY